MLTVKFIRSLLERSLSSTAIGALAAWTITTNWHLIASFSGLMGVYTALKCLGACPVGDKGTPSLLKGAD